MSVIGREKFVVYTQGMSLDSTVTCMMQAETVSFASFCAGSETHIALF